MTKQIFLDYNKYLIDNHIECDIISYVKHVNSIIADIDIQFMDELISFMERDSCCIPHTFLVRYGIFKNTKDVLKNTKISLKFNEMINGSNLCAHNIEMIECILCKDKVDYVSVTHNDIETLYLKPDTFKFMLLRSKYEKKYIKYYMLLEKAIKYYQDYQLLYHNISALASLERTIKKQHEILLNMQIRTLTKIDILDEKITFV